MLNLHFEHELGRLRSLASEFAARNPALAPMLGTDVAPDPDVERLLEGVAFLTGLMRQRLDDDFPEFVQPLVQLLAPHFLRPWPCMTIMAFEPTGPLGGTLTLPAGSALASVPVDGAPMQFRTAFDLAVEPLSMSGANWEGGDGVERSIVLDFAFEGVSAPAWRGERIGLYLADAAPDALRLLLLLARYVREVHLSAPGEPVTVLPPGMIGITGLQADALLLPLSENAHPAHELLREYFAFPEKFMHVSVEGLSRWQARGTSGRFRMRFVFNEVPDWAPAVHAGSFLLNTAAAVNLFPAQAHPVEMDGRESTWPLRFHDKGTRKKNEVFSIEHVNGYGAGRAYSYAPFGAARTGEPTCHVSFRESPLRNGIDSYVSIVPVGAAAMGIEPQTLSIEALCTQGARPEVLRLGDICRPTDSSPARMNFRNIRRVSSYRPPILDQRLLWRLVSQLNVNYQPLASVEQLRATLSLQLASVSGGAVDASCQQRIDAIEACAVRPAERLMRGTLVSGSEISLSCRSDAFVNLGGLFLFGAVLDEFFAGTITLNTFSALSITDTLTGSELRWPAKIGQQRLL